MEGEFEGKVKRKHLKYINILRNDYGLVANSEKTKGDKLQVEKYTNLSTEPELGALGVQDKIEKGSTIPVSKKLYHAPVHLRRMYQSVSPPVD